LTSTAKKFDAFHRSENTHGGGGEKGIIDHIRTCKHTAVRKENTSMPEGHEHLLLGGTEESGSHRKPEEDRKVKAIPLVPSMVTR